MLKPQKYIKLFSHARTSISVLLTLMLSVFLMQCAANKSDDKTTQANSTPTNSSPQQKCDGTSSSSMPILVYAHSSDYTTYKIDFLCEDGTLNANVLSVSSSGIRSAQFFNGKFIFVNSKSGGTLEIYDPADYSTAAASVNLDNADTNINGEYPQEFVIVNNKAYVALQGPYGTNQNKVAIVDLSNVSSPSIAGTITVGNQPANVRYNGTNIYVTNQDWNDKTQSSVSIIDPNTNTVSASINVGENPSDVAFGQTNIWTYDSKWFQGTSASLTAINGSTPTTITSFPSGYSPSYGGNIVVTNNTGYVLLSNGSTFHLFSFADNPTNPNFTAVDTTNQYKYIGTGPQGYFYLIHNGDGSTNNLTVTVKNGSGASVGTYSLTKDADMSFWPQK